MTVAHPVHEARPTASLRSKESFPFVQEIIKPYGELDSIIAWCKSECRDIWRWQLLDISSDTCPGKYRFYFDSDLDCSAFIIKWC